MGRVFQTGRHPAGSAPSIMSVPYTSGQTFKKGALVALVAAGTVSECGADPTKVYGVALQGAGTGLGYGMANNPSQITGRVGEVSVAMADRQNMFTGRMVNGGTDPVTPTTTMRGESYGVLKTGAGEWVIDGADTTNLVVVIEDIDIAKKVFLFRFLEAVLDLP